MTDNDYNIQNDIDEILDKTTAERLKELRHGEGILTSGRPSYQSVVQRLATTIGDNDKDYRQALLLASFLSPDESDKAVKAIAECHRFGAPITIIVDKIIAGCAVKGAGGGRVQNIIDALTSQRITANTPGGFKKYFAQNKNKNSPIGNE